MKQDVIPDKVLDCIGLFCPMPIVKIRDTITPMATGQVLEMLSDDPTSVEDMKTWSRRSGQELVTYWKDGSVYHYLVRKVR